MTGASLDRDLARFRAEHPRKHVVSGPGVFEYTIGGTGPRAVVLLHGGGSTAEATHRFALALAPSLLAAQRRASFDTRVSKQSLLSDADVLIGFFSGPSASPSFDPARVMIVEAMVDDVERAGLRARYPGAHVLTLEGADHFAGALAPAPVADAMARFLAC